MVTMEAARGHERAEEVQAMLEHHWMLDSSTAAEFAQSVSPAGVDELNTLIEPLQSEAAIDKRDLNRQEVIKIFNGESDKQLFIIGPCSLDLDTNYTELFD